MLNKVLILLIIFGSLHIAQNKDRKPIKIIIDSDMGSDCDDAGALALLHKYCELGKAEIVGCIYSSGKVPFGAGIIQAINMFYGRKDIPIGAYNKTDIGDPIDKMGAEKLVKDTSAFGNDIIYNHDAREQVPLLRELLASATDSSIVYVTVGHTKALYDLLNSEGDEISTKSGFDLVRKKVKSWVALGALGASNKEKHFKKDWNFFFNGTAEATEYLVNNFPNQIYFIDGGKNVLTGQSLKHTSSGNIVRTIYRDWLWNVEKKTLDDQRPSWDLVAVYFAVEGKGKYLKELGAGRLIFDSNKGCLWDTEDLKENHNYIKQIDGVEKSFSEYLNKMIIK